jgi:hypothetical protein
MAPANPPTLRGTVPGLELRNDRPASQAAIRPAPTGASAKAGEPLQLPGVITRGTNAASERPAANSAIRPRPAATAAVQAAKVQPAKAAPKKQPAKKKPAEDDE